MADFNEPSMGPTLWLDVEDLFEFVASNTRPTGIQRFAFEIYRALQQARGQFGCVKFVRHDQRGQTFRMVPWSSVAQLFDRLTEATDTDSIGQTISTKPGGGMVGPSRLRRLMRRLVFRLPSSVRWRFLVACRLQLQAAQAVVDLVRFSVSRVPVAVRRRLRVRRSPQDDLGAGGDIATLARPGDFLAVLGAPSTNPDHIDLVINAKRRLGLQFAVLIYDLIPLRRPEWCGRGTWQLFSGWFSATLVHADVILAISRSTADDVERFAVDSGIVLRSRAAVIPVGTGFGGKPPTSGARSARLPPVGSYVLFVSTIEPRKNHFLLLRVWRRMLDEMSPDLVPTLVFAGRVGWMVDDLMEQLENSAYLDGKVCVIESVSDAELAGLYRGCLFTVFPSHYEGWGLPVTESFAFGKPCIASRSSSLPEAGGRLARYFDPDNTTEAYAVIRAVIEDPVGLKAWEADVVRCFVPVSWDETARVVMESLGMLEPVAAEVVG